MQKLNDSICAVVPVYNSQNTLCTVVEKLIDVLACFRKYRIVLVDDCSTDNSFDIIKDLYSRYENIIGIKLSKNHGQQCAVFCGLHYSDCDYTLIIDDDMEHNPADILVLYHEIIKGYDTVYGINDTVGTKGIFRNFGSRLRDRLFDKITDKPKDKKVCSFRIMNKKTVDYVLQANTKFVYISLEILKHTNNIQNVAVPYNPPVQSNYKPIKLILLLLNMYVYYAPAWIFKKLRRKNKCYDIQEILSKGYKL